MKLQIQHDFRCRDQMVLTSSGRPLGFQLSAKAPIASLLFNPMNDSLLASSDTARSPISTSDSSSKLWVQPSQALFVWSWEAEAQAQRPFRSFRISGLSLRYSKWFHRFLQLQSRTDLLGFSLDAGETTSEPLAIRGGHQVMNTAWFWSRSSFCCCGNGIGRKVQESETPDSRKPQVPAWIPEHISAFSRIFFSSQKKRTTSRLIRLAYLWQTSVYFHHGFLKENDQRDAISIRFCKFPWCWKGLHAATAAAGPSAGRDEKSCAAWGTTYGLDLFFTHHTNKSGTIWRTNMEFIM